MFLGRYEGQWDGEGYLKVPQELRPQLGLGFVLTRGLGECLWIYPLCQWRSLVEELHRLPFSRADARALGRFLFAEAQECQLSEKGYLFIPESLRRHARLEGETLIVGLDSHLEIWDTRLWQDLMLEIEEEAISIGERVSEQLLLSQPDGGRKR
ncbi:MAG: division/cell wall cluster transcriptional repressor MraZ [Anaerolineae bacterium]